MVESVPRDLATRRGGCYVKVEWQDDGTWKISGAAGTLFAEPAYTPVGATVDEAKQLGVTYLEHLERIAAAKAQHKQAIQALEAFTREHSRPEGRSDDEPPF